MLHYIFNFLKADVTPMLPDPNTTFAVMVATLYGATFHLIVGGDARRLALFLLASWLGFGLGHVSGVLLEINIVNIGALRIVTATLGAFTALLAAKLLTARTPRKRITR